MQSNWKLGLGFSLVTAVMWGALPISLKVVLVELDSTTLTWYRFSVSAGIALLWYGHRSTGGLKRLLSRPLLPVTALAVFGLLGNYILYLIGLDHTTAEAAQILIQLAPLLLVLGSIWLFKEPFSRLQWVGVLGFTTGLLLFFHHRLSALTSLEHSYVLGMLTMLFASITWAAYGLAQKRLLSHVSANELLLLIYLAGTLCFLPVASPSQAQQLDAVGLAMLAFAALNTLVAYGSFGLAMTHWEASRASAVITIAPLLTLLFIFVSNTLYPGFIQTEPLDWLNWVGATLVVAGSVMASVGNRR